jgi:hypothetical protein
LYFLFKEEEVHAPQTEQPKISQITEETNEAVQGEKGG